MASSQRVIVIVLLAVFVAQPVQAQPLGADGKPCIGDVPIFPDFDIIDGKVRNKPSQQKRTPLKARPLAGSFKPLTYRDPTTKIFFYVESDGEHLSAISPEGKLLWSKSWNLCPYRVSIPWITAIRNPYKGRSRNGIPLKEEGMRIHLAKMLKRDSVFIDLTFSSSHFGYVDQKTGEFFLMGNN